MKREGSHPLPPSRSGVRSASELLDQAGVPTTVPPILEPRHVEAVLGINRTQRRQLEAVGILAPMERRAYEHARYRTLDVACAIVEHALRARWDRLSDA